MESWLGRDFSGTAMSDEITPRRYINIKTAPMPPWTKKVNLSIEKVEEIFASSVAGSLQVAIDSYDNDLYYSFTKRFTSNQEWREKAKFVIILRSTNGDTLIEMNTPPIDAEDYLDFFKTISSTFKRKGISFDIDAPLLSEENYTLPATTPVPKPKRTAKMILTAYKNRRKREPDLTLKQFCADIGANYDSVKSAKYRYSKPKKPGRKRLP